MNEPQPSPRMHHRALIQQARGSGDDRAHVVDRGDWLIACVADGAGGTGSGGLAADAVVGLVEELGAGGLPGERDLVRAIRALDGRLAASGGETTAVIAVVTRYLVLGASVGDSQAIYATTASVEALTMRQQRKPLVGSGRAVVTGFGCVVVPAGRLLIATDGLFNYQDPTTIEGVLRGELDAIPRRFLEGAKLPNGELRDDIALIVVETPGTND